MIKLRQIDGDFDADTVFKDVSTAIDHTLFIEGLIFMTNFLFNDRKKFNTYSRHKSVYQCLKITLDDGSGKSLGDSKSN